MIIYLHGFNSSSSSSKAQLCKKYLTDKGLGDEILIPDLPLSTYKVVNLIEMLISENEIVGFIGSSMGGFYSCYFANKYNLKGVYINPVVDNHLPSMLNIVGSYENFNNGKKDTFSINDYENLKKYSTKRSLYFGFIKNRNHCLRHGTQSVTPNHSSLAASIMDFANWQSHHLVC